MSNDKKREEFDAAWSRGELLELDGPFNDPRKNQIWAAWQASREALVIELPEMEWLHHDEAREAIESYGLKVRP